MGRRDQLESRNYGNQFGILANFGVRSQTYSRKIHPIQANNSLILDDEDRSS